MTWFLLLSTLIISLLSGCSNIPGKISADQVNDLQKNKIVMGEWEGTIFVPSKNFNETLRFSFENSEVKVFEKNSISGIWNELSPGNFKLLASRYSPIIHMTHMGTDEDGVWAETWVFVTKPQSEHELEVEWIRTVRNFNLPKTNSDNFFSYTGIGIFKRN